LSDLQLISSQSRQLTAAEEPSPQVWLRIAAQLRAEGLIHDKEPESASVRPILVPPAVRVASGRRWSAWWLAPVAAAVIAAGSYMVRPKLIAPLAQKQSAPAPATSPSVAPAAVAPPDTAASATAPASPQIADQQMAAKSAAPARVTAPVVEPGPDSEDQQFLSEVSTRAPSMRATYERQLQAVNADIRETQAYVDRNPGDADARQHLMDAYQQKALLYQIALDRIQ
jgi:hypothetical protein